MNDRGEAISAWAACEGAFGSSLGVVRAAVRRADGTWGRPANLGYGGSDVDAAIDGNGNAVVVWSRNGVYAESRSAEGTWENATVLSAGRGGGGKPQVVMNRRGDALALWGEFDASGLSLMSSVRRAHAANWTSPSRVPVSDAYVGLYSYYGVSFALDDSGNTTVVTQRHDGQVEVATRAFDAETWEAPVVIGNGGAGDWYARDSWCVNPRIALDASGGAVVIWGGMTLQSARRVGSQQWQPPVTVATSPACFQRALAVDAAGNAVAIWNGSQEAASRIDAAVLDATPPVLERLVVPSAARPRRRIRFSIAASDAWSSLTRPPLWEFGDGSRGRGAIVRHSYRRPGRYRVTVAASDKAGNTATRTAVVRIVRARKAESTSR